MLIMIYAELNHTSYARVLNGIKLHANESLSFTITSVCIFANHKPTTHLKTNFFHLNRFLYYNTIDIHHKYKTILNSNSNSI